MVARKVRPLCLVAHDIFEKNAILICMYLTQFRDVLVRRQCQLNVFIIVNPLGLNASPVRLQEITATNERFFKTEIMQN